MVFAKRKQNSWAQIRGLAAEWLCKMRTEQGENHDKIEIDYKGLGEGQYI